MHAKSGDCLTLATEPHQDNLVFNECDIHSPSQTWNITLQDINKPIPEWAKIAEGLNNQYNVT